MDSVDVIIIGAGLSGISAAYHLKKLCPNKSLLILERRQNLGGTWDLFRYPGIRSDSDMFTLGFTFSNWKNSQRIADGSSILEYLKETAAKFDLEKYIRYNSKVESANFDTSSAKWTLQVKPNTGDSSTTIQFTSSFIFMCAGYYNYDQGHSPSFPGSENFKGVIVHPQHWPTNLDYTNKKVVVIGSGATAVTLVPSLAKKASHVTMLQRTPTYMLPLPKQETLYITLMAIFHPLLGFILPVGEIVSWICKWFNIIQSVSFYISCKLFPQYAQKIFKSLAYSFINTGKPPSLFSSPFPSSSSSSSSSSTSSTSSVFTQEEIDVHFSPPYLPWDQRVCVLPNADLYRLIHSSSSSSPEGSSSSLSPSFGLGKGKVSIVTGRIKQFTLSGIELETNNNNTNQNNTTNNNNASTCTSSSSTYSTSSSSPSTTTTTCSSSPPSSSSPPPPTPPSSSYLDADIIVTATGLNLQLFGGISLSIDSLPYSPSQSLLYTGCMLTSLPNFTLNIGYTNASWTLKVDLSNEWICKILIYMDKMNYKIVQPKLTEEENQDLLKEQERELELEMKGEESSPSTTSSSTSPTTTITTSSGHSDPNRFHLEPILALNSNYFLRSAHLFPKQGSRLPWKLYQNYFIDWWMFKFCCPVNSPHLQYKQKSII